MSALRGHALRALGWLLGSLPGVALACPVCFAAKDEANRIAFLLVTVFLTALPVIMIGSLIVWIARRSAQLDQEEREQPPRPLPEAEAPARTEAEEGKLIPLRR